MGQGRLGNELQRIWNGVRPDTAKYVAAADMIASRRWKSRKEAQHQERKMELAWQHHLSPEKVNKSIPAPVSSDVQRRGWLEPEGQRQKIRYDYEDEPVPEIAALKKRLIDMQREWEEKIRNEYNTIGRLNKRRLQRKHRRRKKHEPSEADPTTSVPLLTSWLQRHNAHELSNQVEKERVNSIQEQIELAGNRCYTEEPIGFRKSAANVRALARAKVSKLKVKHASPILAHKPWVGTSSVPHGGRTLGKSCTIISGGARHLR